MIRTTRRRSAFTLLEVMLASSISLLLLGGLYIILDLQIEQMSAGREKVERTTVVRSIFNRFSRDLSYSMTPLSAVQAVADATAADTSTAATASTMTETGSTLIPPGSGVIGDASSITIYGAKIAGSIEDADDEAAASQPGDQRKITFWVGAGGLCRSEEKWTTSDEGQNTSADTGAEDLHLIAPEVESMQLEYFDGTTFTDSWDGSQLAEDGMTPIGPPRAIRVILMIKIKDGESKEFRKTIAILTGPSPPTTADQTEPAATTTTTGGTAP